MIEAVLKRNQPDLVQFSRDYLAARSGEKARLSFTFSNCFSPVRLPHLFSRSPQPEIDRVSLSPSPRNVKAKTRTRAELDFPKSSAIFTLRCRHVISNCDVKIFASSCLLIYRRVSSLSTLNLLSIIRRVRQIDIMQEFENLLEKYLSDNAYVRSILCIS